MLKYEHRGINIITHDKEGPQISAVLPQFTTLTVISLGSPENMREIKTAVWQKHVSQAAI